LEVHDVTGSGEAAAAGTLAAAAQYWVDISSALVGQENFVIINIANEPIGNNQPASAWINQHIAAIQTIRNAGLTHTLLIDAANWGQDWQQIMLANASQVANADFLDNTMFSVHMYEVYQNLSTIENYVSTFLSQHNLPLIVGEFGADHQGNPVDEDSIFAVAEQYGIGYLGWSWSGNGSCCVSLDIVNNFNPGIRQLRTHGRVNSRIGTGNAMPLSLGQLCQTAHKSAAHAQNVYMHKLTRFDWRLNFQDAQLTTVCKNPARCRWRDRETVSHFPHRFAAGECTPCGRNTAQLSCSRHGAASGIIFTS